MSSELRERISAEVEKIKIVDTHEHIALEKDRVAQKVDFFHWFGHYASADLVSAGMTQKELEEIRNPDRPLEERWRKFAPHWGNIKNTAYAKAVMIAAKDLFGVEQINERTVGELSEKIAAANKPGYYRWVLKEKAGIEVSVWDGLRRMGYGLKGAVADEVDRDFFLPVIRFDHYILVRTPKTLAELEEESGVSIHSLDDLLSAVDSRLERAIQGGIVGIKVGLAYLRSLKFEKTTKADAERVFNRIFTLPFPYPTWEDWQMLAGPAGDEAKPLQDFVLHHVLRRASEERLPVQIHTGLQEGNGNVITNSDPTLLVNLFFEYKDVKFDIFHGSYPYCSELATLAKNFPNVYADMCWLHVISPAVARRALEEWLETVPGNKIFGFGGDYIFVEGAYAHSRMARQTITRLLADKVEEDYFTEEESVTLAQKILRENPAALYCAK